MTTPDAKVAESKMSRMARTGLLWFQAVRSIRDKPVAETSNHTHPCTLRGECLSANQADGIAAGAEDIGLSEDVKGSGGLFSP